MSSGDGAPPEGGYGAPWPGPGRGDPDGFSDEDGIPGRVVVFDEEEERSRTWWLPRGKPILLVAAAAAAFLVIGSTSPGHGTGDVDAGRQAADPVPSSGAAAAAPSSSRSEEDSVFDQRAEALATALARYRDRRPMYERGRLGCGSLESAHDSVDRSFLEMALTVRDLRESLDSSSRARFDDLADRADEVDRHFDGSACRSPG